MNWTCFSGAQSPQALKKMLALSEDGGGSDRSGSDRSRDVRRSESASSHDLSPAPSPYMSPKHERLKVCSFPCCTYSCLRHDTNRSHCLLGLSTFWFISINFVSNLSKNNCFLLGFYAIPPQYINRLTVLSLQAFHTIVQWHTQLRSILYVIQFLCFVVTEKSKRSLGCHGEREQEQQPPQSPSRWMYSRNVFVQTALISFFADLQQTSVAETIFFAASACELPSPGIQSAPASGKRFFPVVPSSGSAPSSSRSSIASTSSLGTYSSSNPVHSSTSSLCGNSSPRSSPLPWGSLGSVHSTTSASPRLVQNQHKNSNSPVRTSSSSSADTVKSSGTLTSVLPTRATALLTVPVPRTRTKRPRVLNVRAGGCLFHSLQFHRISMTFHARGGQPRSRWTLLIATFCSWWRQRFRRWAVLERVIDCCQGNAAAVTFPVAKVVTLRLAFGKSQTLALVARRSFYYLRLCINVARKNVPIEQTVEKSDFTVALNRFLCKEKRTQRRLCLALRLDAKFEAELLTMTYNSRWLAGSKYHERPVIKQSRNGRSGSFGGVMVMAGKSDRRLTHISTSASTPSLSAGGVSQVSYLPTFPVCATKL